MQNAILVISLLFAVPAAASKPFDLECGLEESPLQLRIDPVSESWCYGDCGTGVYGMVNLDDTFYVLVDGERDKNKNQQWLTYRINRLTVNFETVTRNSASVENATEWDVKKLACKVLPFSGFPKAKI